MRLRFTLPPVFALVVLLGGCGKSEEDYAVRGAHLLANDSAGDHTAYDIIAYPLTQVEMDYFVDNVERFASAISSDAEGWNRLQFVDEPMNAIRDHPVWRKTGLISEDFLAAFAKLDFLQGYAADPTPPKQLKRAAAQLERAYEQGGPDAELARAIVAQRKLARAAEVSVPEALELFAANKKEIDQALDRFRSLGDH